MTIWNTIHNHMHEVRRMRRRGCTLQEIADRFGVTRQAVWAALKRQEIATTKITQG